MGQNTPVIRATPGGAGDTLVFSRQTGPHSLLPCENRSRLRAATCTTSFEPATFAALDRPRAWPPLHGATFANVRQAALEQFSPHQFLVIPKAPIAKKHSARALPKAPGFRVPSTERIESPLANRFRCSSPAVGKQTAICKARFRYTRLQGMVHGKKLAFFPANTSPALPVSVSGPSVCRFHPVHNTAFYVRLLLGISSRWIETAACCPSSIPSQAVS